MCSSFYLGDTDERLWMIQSRLEEALVQLIGSNLLKSRTFASGTVYLIGM